MRSQGGVRKPLIYYAMYRCYMAFLNCLILFFIFNHTSVLIIMTMIMIITSFLIFLSPENIYLSVKTSFYYNIYYNIYYNNIMYILCKRTHSFEKICALNKGSICMYVYVCTARFYLRF